MHHHREQDLGRPAYFLLPSFKVNCLYPGRKGVLTSTLVKEFLLEGFGGYSAPDYIVKGAWRDSETGTVYQGEFVPFFVSFLGKERIPILTEFLSTLAHALEEECIYLETGEDARLVFASGVSQEISSPS